MDIYNCKKTLQKYGNSLSGKNIALFGATGGIGNELCRYILTLGGTLITVDRNVNKAKSLREKLLVQFPNATIHTLIADLEDINSLTNICEELKRLNTDTVIHNAGAYNIPRKTCCTGYDNVFQINFVSPYFITNRLLSHLSQRSGRIIVVGSIAHNYSKTDKNDIDFSTRKKSSLVYGNAKRYAIFAHIKLLSEHPNVKLAVTHPGITFTNITAHYPKLLFAVIKHPMKIIFMPRRVAALSVLEGIFKETQGNEWIGPAIFDIWGKPKLKPLKTAKADEIDFIDKTAKIIYSKLQKNAGSQEPAFFTSIIMMIIQKTS